MKGMVTIGPSVLTSPKKTNKMEMRVITMSAYTGTLFGPRCKRRYFFFKNCRKIHRILLDSLHERLLEKKLICGP